MKQSILVVTALALMFALPALAADNAPVLGEWTSTNQTQQGNVQVVYEFTEADGKLNGAFRGPRNSGDLKNVSWDGETLSFGRDLGRGGRSVELRFKATVDGDTMTGTMSTPRGDRPFKASRSK